MFDEAARAWAEDDPDPVTRAQVEAWLAAGDHAALEAAFGHRLRFGTAGIRGPRGPGPAGMNRRLVRAVAAGLAAHLRATDSSARIRDVVVGHDARVLSPELADDAARVLAGAGLRTCVLPGPVPTPLVSFAVRHFGAAAGLMVTASHNPPADNGVKVYGADGAQIIPPVDTAISDAIDAVDRVLDLPLADPELVGDQVLEAYLDAAAERVPAGPRDALLVHTALHGVGSAPLRALFRRAGFDEPVAVAAQAEPDGAFPTVPYPNPEEPGTLDLAIAEARRIRADAVIATDPDADRLGVAIPDGAEWRVLSGDEIGVLLAHQALETTSGPGRVVASSIVSSTLIGALAADAGARWVTTLTGSKWIVRAADDQPDSRFVFGYEEALGYVVHDLVRDKDGLTAAAAFAALVARLKSEKRTVAGLLDDIDRRYGVHATQQWSIRDVDAATVAHRLVGHPPTEVAGRTVIKTERPTVDMIVLGLDDDSRVIVRPSGTEPKLKCYFQVVLQPVDDVATARAAAEARIDALRESLADRLTGGTMDG